MKETYYIWVKITSGSIKRGLTAISLDDGRFALDPRNSLSDIFKTVNDRKIHIAEENYVTITYDEYLRHQDRKLNVVTDVWENYV